MTHDEKSRQRVNNRKSATNYAVFGLFLQRSLTYAVIIYFLSRHKTNVKTRINDPNVLIVILLQTM